MLLVAIMPLASSAQLKRADESVLDKPRIEKLCPKAQPKVMPDASPTKFLGKTPKNADTPMAYYRRPAGGFVGTLACEDGVLLGTLYTPYVFLKPKAEYTFMGMPEGVEEGIDYKFSWDYQINGTEGNWLSANGKNLTVKYGYDLVNAPIFYIAEGDNLYSWNMEAYEMGGDYNNPFVTNSYVANIAAINNPQEIDGYDILKCSKNFSRGGRDGNKLTSLAYYVGLNPTEDQNDGYGYWFGKNNGTFTQSNGEVVTRRIDGIGQAFEKPEHPYRLNKVYLYTAKLDIAENQDVEMTCKIYRLEKMKEYGEGNLPEVPGQLIAEGIASINSSTYDTTNGLITFTLYTIDPVTGQLVETNPIINYPILIAIDGYNKPEMAALRDFTAWCSTDDQVDEGFGELAYVKYGINDENGNFTGEYEWASLYNIWGIKTGLSILISTSFNNTDEISISKHREHILPNQQLTLNVTTNPADLNIEVSTNNPNVAQIKVVGNTIQVTGVSEGEATITVNSSDGKSSPDTCHITVYTEIGDVNHDGTMNIDDVVALIDVLLGNTSNPTDNADFDRDGVVSISDVIAIIDYVLNGVNWIFVSQVREVIPDRYLDIFEGHMPIYYGHTPPIIEGTYLISPDIMLFSTAGGYDLNPFADGYFKFTDQNSLNDTVHYEYTSTGTEFESSYKSILTGSENNFTVFFKTTGTCAGIRFEEVILISGTIDSTGISNLYHGFVMLDKGRDWYNVLVPIGAVRVFKDGDEHSPRTTWPNSVTLKGNNPTGSSILKSGHSIFN